MPHLIIEHSSNLGAVSFDRILPALNRRVTASPAIADESDLKTRVRVNDAFSVGNQAEGRAYVHAELRLLAGRSAEAKQDLAARVAQVLRDELPRPADLQVQLSVDVVDMDRDCYVKDVLR